MICEQELLQALALQAHQQHNHKEFSVMATAIPYDALVLLHRTPQNLPVKYRKKTS
jgi:hypothetical protein